MKITYDFFEEKTLGQFYFASFEEKVFWVYFNQSYSLDALEKHLVSYLKEPVVLSHQSFPKTQEVFKAYMAKETKELPISYQIIKATDFQRSVYLACKAIEYGETKTYGELAKELNNPKASRAVGQALRNNPLPLIIPCHRVIGSDYSMRGYGGKEGVGTKAKLLELEGVLIKNPPKTQPLF